MRIYLVALVALCLLPLQIAADTQEPTVVFRSGDYSTAIPLLQAAVANGNKDPLVHAALVSALVYEGLGEAASKAAASDAVAYPNSPDVIAARGELAYYMADMAEAERLFRAALKLKEATPRAYYGMYRLFRAASMYRTARLMCLRAHEIDPDDALITQSWLSYLVPEKRRELLPPFIAAHPWFYKHLEQQRTSLVEVSRELSKRKLFDFTGVRKEVTLHLAPLMNSATQVRGLGIEFRINGGRPLKLLLDTGASGILVKESAVDNADLAHLGAGEGWGIGDSGPRKMFAAIADTCAIGPLKYNACLIRATEGKGRIAGDEDGLIGADFFSDYLVEIDFRKRQLHLTPLPEREPNPQGYDREVSPAEKNFHSVFRYGNQLLIPTTLNGKSRGLFLIDSGAAISNVDSTFARNSTSISGNAYMHVTGVSGRVKDVFEASKGVIEFAGYRQNNIGLVAFNLNNSFEHREVRLSGILGFPVLSLFRLTIDYRNGLVKFDYIYK